jgi:plasmid stabilization system protein ParE
MTTVIVTRKAKSDLIGIRRYIALDNPSRAASFSKDMMQKTIKNLGDFPKSAPIYNSDKNIRRLVYQNYNIYYRYDDQSDTAYVLHILNAALLMNSSI